MIRDTRVTNIAYSYMIRNTRAPRVLAHILSTYHTSACSMVSAHHKITLCLLHRYRHRNLSAIVPVSPYKILYSYVALVPAPSCIWQYKFVHKSAGTLDTAIKLFWYVVMFTPLQRTSVRDLTVH